MQSTDLQKRGLGWSVSFSLLLAPYLNPVSASAEGESTASSPSASGLHGAEFDLSSTRSSLQSTHTTPIDIQVGGTISNGVVTGGTTYTVAPGQFITPAQFQAIAEVMGGGQTLLVGTAGNAVGGYTSLSSNTVQQLNNIMVPQNVSLNAIGFNATTPLNVAGSLNIAGSVFTLQNTPGIATMLNLGSLNIASGGLLSGSLPTAVNAGSAVFASGGMNLNVLNNVVNMGTITTPGVLNIVAGGSIVNQTMNNIAATMSAQTVNLFSSSGQFVNSGLITANANLNLSTLLSQDLNLNNTGGILESLNGSINVRDSLYAGGANSVLSGGALLSRELNLNGGSGTVDAFVDRITGVTNVEAGCLHLGVTNGDLQFGNVSVTGDPIIYNQGGNVSLPGLLTFLDSDLAIVARGTVTVGDINLQGSLSKSGSLLVVGGADFGVGPDLQLVGPPPVTITITGASGAAGDVVTGNINTAGNQLPGNHAGGSVTLISYNGTVATGNISTGGTAAGATSNGDVLVIAQAAPGVGVNGISTGIINTGGGTAGGGTITLSTSAPTFTGANVTFNPTLTGYFLPATPYTTGPVASLADISAVSLTTDGAKVSVFAGGNALFTGGLISTQRVAANGAGGAVNVLAGMSATSPGIGSIQGLTTVTANGKAAAGGAIVLASGTAATTLGTITSNGGAASAGGSIDLIAGGDLTVTSVVSQASGSVAATPAQTVFIASGANWSVNAANTRLTIDRTTPGATGALTVIGAVDTRPVGTGNGGNINLVAFGSAGTITASGGQNSGGNAANNGNYVAIAQGSPVAVSNTITLGSVSTAGGTGTAGAVTIATANPYAANPTVTLSTAALSAAPALNYNNAIVNAAVSIGGNVNSNGGAVTILAGDGINMNSNAISSVRTSGASAGGIIQVLAGAPTGSAGQLTNLGNVSSNGGAGAFAAGQITLFGRNGISQVAAGAIQGKGVGTGATVGSGGAVTVLSGGNITLGSGGVSTNSAGGGAAASVAGAIIVVSGGNFSDAGAAASITLSGASASGGSITAGNFDSRALTATGAGGAVQLAALGLTSGTVDVGTISTRGGTTTGNSGNVSVYAEGPGTSVKTQVIQTAGNSAATGTVTLATASPYGVAGASFPKAAAGATAMSLNVNQSVLALNSAVLVNGAITTNGAAVLLIAGGNLTTGDLTSTRTATNGAGGPISAVAGANTVTTGAGILSLGNIAANGLNSLGGNILLASGKSALTLAQSIGTNGAGAAGTNGGNVTIVSGDALTLNGTISSRSSSGSATAHNVSLLSGASWLLQAGGAGIAIGNASASTNGALVVNGLVNTTALTTGAGGSVNLAAFGTAGTITVNLLPTAQGNGSNNGNFAAVAQGQLAAPGATITITGAATINTGGGTGGTGTILLATNDPLAAASTNVNFGSSLANLSLGALNQTVLSSTPGISAGNLQTDGATIQVLAGGDVALGTVDSSRSSGSGVAGNIALVAGAVTAGNALTARTFTSLGNVTAVGAGGNGGNILIAAGTTALTLNTINANASGAAAAVGGNIAVLTGGNLTLSNTLTSRSVSNGNTVSSVTLVAGASWTTTNTTLTLNAVSTATNGALVVNAIDTSTANTGAGANVRLAAYGVNGTITVNGAQTTGGSSTFSSGAFQASADGTPAVPSNTISFAAGLGVNAGTGGAGAILLQTGTPYSANAGFTLLSPTGGAFTTNLTPAVLSSAPGIAAGDLTSSGGAVTVIAGGDVALGNVSSNRVQVGIGGNIAIMAGARTTGIGAGSITSLGSVSANGMTANSGNILIASGTGATLNLLGNISSTSANSGLAGNVTIVGGTNVNLGSTLTAVNNNVAGQSVISLLSGSAWSLSSNAVNITFSNVGSGAGGALTVGAINTTPGVGTTGSGNHVRLLAFGNGGTITVTGAQTTGGSAGNFVGGQFIAIAQGNPGAVTNTITFQSGAVVDASGGQGASGIITIATASPLTAASTVAVSTVVPGNVGPLYSATIVDAGVSLQSLKTDGAAITVLASGNSNFNNQFVSSSRLGATGSGGAIQITAGAPVASTTGSISGLGSVTADGFSTAAGVNGGAIALVGRYGIAMSAGSVISSNGGGVGAVGAGGALAVVSQGNIDLAPAGITLNSKGTGAGAINGGSMMVFAGNSLLDAGGNTVTITTTISGVGGSVKTGDISTRALTSAGNGGVLQIGANGTSGTIQTGSISTQSGTASGTGSNVALFAGGSGGGDTITINGAINAVGVSPGGTVSALTQVPAFAGGGAGVLTKNTATLTALVSSISQVVLATNPGISGGDISTNGAQIQVFAGGNVSLGNLNASRASAASGTAGGISVVAGANTVATGSGGITKLGTVTTDGLIGAGGAIVIAAGTSGATLSGAISSKASGGAAAAGGNVLLISAGDLTVTGAVSSRNVAGSATQNSVTMFAGAQWTLSGNTLTVQTASTAASGALKTGVIDGTPIDTGAGVNVRLAAYGANGTITVNGTQSTGGTGGFNNGTFQAVAQGAPAAPGQTITFNAGAHVSTTGGGPATGVVQIFTSNPLTANFVVNILNSGAIGLATNSFSQSIFASRPAITTQNITTNGANIQVYAGGAITTGNVDASRIAGAAGSGGRITLMAGLDTVTADAAGALNTGSLTSNGLGAGAGGLIYLTSGNSPSTIASVTSIGGVGGGQGGMSIFAGGQLTISGAVQARNNNTVAASISSVVISAGLNRLTNLLATQLTLIPGSTTSAGALTIGSLNTSPVAGSTGSGNNVSLAGFGSNGSVTVTGTQITGGSTGAFAPGSYVVIAQGKPATLTDTIVFQSGATVNTTGGTNGGGNVSIYTGNPLTANTSIGISAIAQFGFNYDATNITGGISLNGITTDGRSIGVFAGGNLNLNGQAINSSRTTGTAAGGLIALVAGGPVASIGAISGLGNVLANGFSSSAAGAGGGPINIVGRTGVASVAGSIIQSNGAGTTVNGAGGNLMVLSSGAVNVAPGGITLQNAGTGANLVNSGNASIFSGMTYTDAGVGGTGNTLTLNPTASGLAAPITVGSIDVSTTTVGSAGTITLGAFGTGGTVTVNGAARSIGASGNSGGVRIAAGGDGPGNTITVTGIIDIAGSVGGTGQVLITQNAPFSAAQTITRGTATGGTIVVAASAAVLGTDPGILLQDIKTNAVAVQVIAGGALTVQNVTTTRTTGTGAGGQVNLLAGSRLSGTPGSGALSVASVTANGLTGSSGSIVLAGGTAGATIGAVTGNSVGNNTVPNEIVLISAGDLTVTSNISQRGDTGSVSQSSTILYSGASWVTNGTTTITLSPALASGGANGALTVNGVINTSPQTGGTSQNVALVALGAKGTIALNAAPIISGVGGSNGLFVAVAQGTVSGNTITFSQPVSQTGGAAATGGIRIATGDPFTVASVVVNFNAVAPTFPSATNHAAATLNSGASVSVQGLATNGAFIQILAGGDVSAGNIDASRVAGANGAGGAIAIMAGARITGTTTGAGIISGLGTITSKGLNGNGGNIVLASGTGATVLANAINTSAAGTLTGAAGQITLISGGNFTVNGAVNAQSINGGVAGNILMAAGVGWSLSAAPATNILIDPNAGGSNGALVLNSVVTTTSQTATGASSSLQLAGFGANGTVTVNAAPVLGAPSGAASNDGSLIVVAQGALAGDTIKLNTAISLIGGNNGASGVIRLVTGNPYAANTVVNYTLPSVSGLSTTSLNDTVLTAGAGVKALDLSTNGGVVYVLAGGNVDAGAITTTRTLGAAGTGGAVTVAAGVRQTVAPGAGSIVGLGNIATGGLAGNAGNITLATGTTSTTIGGTLTAIAGAGAFQGGQVNIVAGGDLTFTGSLSSRNSNSSALSATLFASGAAWTVTGGTNLAINPLLSAGGANGAMTIGGAINNSATGTGAGGNLNLFAFGTNGTVTLNTAPLLNGASGAAVNDGSLLVVAQGTLASNTISVTKDISIIGGNLSGGAIRMYTGDPFTATASINLSGGAFGSAVTLNSTILAANPGIATGKLTVSGAQVLLLAGGDVTAGDITATRVAGTGSGGLVQVVAGARITGTPGSGLLTLGAVTTNGNSGDGGRILIAGGTGGVNLNSAITANAASAGAANGAAIELISAGNLDVNAAVSARSINGGNGGSAVVQAVAGAGWNTTATVFSLSNLVASGGSNGALTINGQITTSPSAGLGGGAPVTLVGMGTNGTVTVNVAPVTAANGALNTGNIVVAAQGSGPGDTIKINAANMSTVGATGGGGGAIQLVTATPVTAPVSFSYGVLGSFIVNPTFEQAILATSPGISANNITTDGQSIVVIAGGNVALGAVSGSRVNTVGGGANIQILAGANSVSPGTGAITALSSVVSNGAAGTGGAILIATGTTATNLAAVITSNAGGAFAGGNIMVLGAGDLTVSGNVNSKSGNVATGNRITLASGAGWTIPVGTAANLSVDPALSGSSGALLVTGQIDGSSATGGGTSLSLLAFGSAGSIVMNTAPLLAAGAVAQASGSLTAIASGNPSLGTNSITLGNVNTTGGSNGSGAINVYTGLPLTAISTISRAVVPALATGAANYSNSITSAGVKTGNLTTFGGAITVLAAGNLDAGTLTATGTSGGTILAAAGLVTAGATTPNAGRITALGNVTTNGTNGSGGRAILLSGTGAAAQNIGNITADQLAGAGSSGRIVVVGASDVNVTGTLAARQNVVGGAGSVFVASGTIWTLDAVNVVLDTTASSSTTNGSLTIAGSSSINTRGLVSGAAGGSINLVASGAGGFITVQGSLQSAAGATNAASGAINVAAQGIAARGTDTIVLGNVTTTGGSNGSGAINIFTGRPLATPTVAISRGTAAAPVVAFVADPSIVGSGVQTGALTTTGAAISVRSAGNLTVNAPISSGSAIGGGGAILLGVLQLGDVSVAGGISSISSAGTAGAITISNPGVAGPDGMIRVDGSVTATHTGGGAAINITETVNLPNPPLSINSGLTGTNSIQGVVSGGTVGITNKGTSGIVLGGASNAVTATGSLGIESGADITASAIGDGALNAPTIMLSAVGSIGTAAVAVSFNRNSQVNLGGSAGGTVNLTNKLNGFRINNVTTNIGTATGLVATGGINLTAAAAGAGTAVAANTELRSVNGSMVLVAPTFDFNNVNGVVLTPAGSVTLLPVNLSSNLNSGTAGTFVASLANVTASGGVHIGNTTTYTGNLTVSGTLNSSSNLFFESLSAAGAAFTNNGIVANSGRNVTVTVGGNIVDGVGAVVNGANVQLTSANGSIGGGMAFTTGATGIDAKTSSPGTSINIENLTTGVATTFAANAGGTGVGTVTYTDTGSTDVTGTVLGPSGVAMTVAGVLTVSGAGTIKTLNNNMINISANGLALSVANAIDAGTGTVVLLPATATNDLVFANAVGGAPSTAYLVGLGNILAGSLLIGNGAVTGNISVAAGTSVVLPFAQLNLATAGGFASDGTLDVTAGNLSVAVGGTMALNAGSQTIARNDVLLQAAGDVQLGQAGGAAVVVSAGQASTSSISLMPKNSVQQNGKVQITGTNIVVNDNVTVTSRGGMTAGGTGDLGINASGTINIGQNNKFTAFGGLLWLVSGGDIKIGDLSDLASVGKLDDNGGTFTTTGGFSLPKYNGGATGIFAGGITGGPAAALQALINTRTNLNQTIVGAGIPFLAAGPNFDSSGGSVFQLLNSSVAAPPAVDTVNGNKYTLAGGVVFIQQTGAARVVFDPPSITAVAVELPPPPVVPTPAAPAGPASGGSGNGNGVSLAVPGFVNTGVPTDRIQYEVNISGNQSQTNQHLQSSDGRTWFIAEGPAMPFVLDDNQTIIVGEEGSRLALVQSRTLVLDRGRIAVLAGPQTELTVETDFGSVTIPAGSVVLIDTTNPDLVRVTNLTNTSVQMSVTSSSSAAVPVPVQIRAGEELTVASDQAGSVEPADGIKREALQTNVSVPGRLISKAKIDRAALVESDRLLTCGREPGCLSKRRVDKLKGEITGKPLPDKQDPPSRSGEPVSHGTKPAESAGVVPVRAGNKLRPVAFSTTLGATAATSGQLTSVPIFGAVIKHRGADVDIQGNRVNLRRGEVLLMATRPTIIQTDDSTITVSPGAIVLVSKDIMMTKLRTLWSNGAGNVRQCVGNNHVDVAAGEETLLSKDAKAFESIYATDAVGRRRVRHHDLTNHKLASAEVSLITLMASSPVLRSLTASSSAHDAGTVDKMLKMAACIQLATAAHGTYTNVSRK